MASNPMQRKTRNSFLLGMIVTLLVTGVVIAMLLLMLKQKSEELEAELAARRKVYTLTQDVKAGQILTQDMFSLKNIHSNSIPNDATSVPSVIDSWFLQTKEGEQVYTDKYGLYLDRTTGESDTIVEVIKNTGSEITDINGEKIASGENYVEAGGIVEKVPASTQTQEDEYGAFFVNSTGNDKIVRVYEESLTGEFYIFRLDTSSANTVGNKKRVKEYIEIKNVPVLAKVDMKANTVITQQLVVQSDEKITNDTRETEYNMITLPIDLMTGDYVDIRLRLPSGQNLVVISKKQVEIPMNADSTYIADTIKVNLREDEILTMSSAMVEAYGIKGAELYAVKYIEPAMQEKAYPTYMPNQAVTALLNGLVKGIDLDGDGRPEDLDGDGIQDDYVNLVSNIQTLMATRYSEAARNARKDYLQQTIDNSTDYNQNVESGLEEHLGTSITARQKYLESLNY